MAENDPSLVAITPAMPAGSCLEEFMNRFPERCLDVGIAEGHAVTFCGGIAYGKKMKVVCSIYSTFFQRAFDNLFQDVCLQELPVVFASRPGRHFRTRWLYPSRYLRYRLFKRDAQYGHLPATRWTCVKRTS